MSIYGKTVFPLSWIDKVQVGGTVTSTQLQRLLRACTVLSGQRWTCSVYIADGWEWTSSCTFRLYYPTAGTGRQLLIPYLGAKTCTSTPQVAILTQSGTAINAASSTTTSSITWPTSISNYPKTYIFSPRYANTATSLNYRTPATSGCGVLEFRQFIGTTPMTFGLMFSPYQLYTTSNGFVSYGDVRGQSGPNIQNPTWDYPLLDAGILRLCEEMLDVAETMPIPVVTLPWWTTTPTAGPSTYGAGSMYAGLQTNLRRWVPMTNLQRQRALWIAWSSKTTSTISIDWRVNGSTGYINGSSASNLHMVYRGEVNSTTRFLAALPLTSEMLSTDRSLYGIPLHFVQVIPSNSQNLGGLSAWIGDAP